jgi:hypothetical protein
MNLKIALAVALFCNTAAVSSAFSLDFIGYEGSTLPANPLVIYVPGYGDVRFDTTNGSTLIVDNAYQNDEGSVAYSLSDHEREALLLTFRDAQSLKVDSVEVSLVDTFTVQPALFEAQPNLLHDQRSGNGRHTINWNRVPEPASALLGALGSALLVLRRRR